MIGEVPNLTEEIHKRQTQAVMRGAKGSPSPIPAGHILRRVAGSKCWESEADGQSSFDTENVKPNLPPDVVPTRTYYPLHSAFTV